MTHLLKCSSDLKKKSHIAATLQQVG